MKYYNFILGIKKVTEVVKAGDQCPMLRNLKLSSTFAMRKRLGKGKNPLKYYRRKTMGVGKS